MEVILVLSGNLIVDRSQNFLSNAVRFDGNDKEYFLEQFINFLRLTIANGNPSDDTIASYVSHIKQFGSWCIGEGLNPLAADQRHLILYRAYLLKVLTFKSRTVNAKLIAIRRFYDAAIMYGVIKENPAAGITTDNRKDIDDFGTKFLSAGHLEFLFRLIPEDQSVESARAKAIFCLMALQGLRTVEVHRANVEDIDFNDSIMIVHGKGGKDRIFPREDTMLALTRYLEIRHASKDSTNKTPVFTCIGNRNYGGRLSRDGIRKIVDHWLRIANAKQDGVSCHILRHTFGTQVYEHTKDLRVTQEEMRHKDPKTTAIYAHLANRKQNRASKLIPVDVCLR